MAKLKKISIIIPIYNTGEKLTRCLDSIISQEYQHFECLMIDDGSTDISPSIIEHYAQKDSRFKAFHKPNGGVSSARNFGLERAVGEWILFIDSDDYIKPEHLSRMTAAITEDVDMVLTGFESVQPKGSTYHRYDDRIYKGTDQIKRFVLETDFLKNMIPWDKMFRADLINADRTNGIPDIRYDVCLSLSEDRLFCYDFLLRCKGIACISDITYIHDGTDLSTLTFRKYPSSVNKYKMSVFKRKHCEIIKLFHLQNNEKKQLDEYIENIYSDLINSYKRENNIFRFYLTRILHKLHLL